MMKESDHFYLNQKEPQKSCLLALRNLILVQDKEISESIKWEIPCFSFRKKPFCYLMIEKKTYFPYILMVDGIHLNHPDLKLGNRAKMKAFHIDPEEDIPIEDIVLILQDALDLYKDK